MSNRSKTVASIDIGTSKISVVIGEVTRDGIDIIGAGSHPSSGIKKGRIINMDSTTDSIKTALEEAEAMTGIEIKSAIVGISGGHIEGIKSNGVVAVKDKEIKKNDIISAIDAAKAIVIPMDREVIHILPQEFLVDDRRGIKEPLGMSGVRLEARTYIITGLISAINNIMKCVNKNGVKVQELVLKPMASAESVLTDDEKELGSVLIDMGGGTTDIIVTIKGTIRHFASLPIGGDHVTSDIAVGVRTPISEAEEIKKKYGKASSHGINEDAFINSTSIGNKKSQTISQKTVTQIIEARIDETFELIKKEISAAGYIDQLPAGVVLTGGTSLLKGIAKEAQDILGMPVRIGSPINIEEINEVKNPVFATGTGMIKLASKGNINSFSSKGKIKNLLNCFDKINDWFKEAF